MKTIITCILTFALATGSAQSIDTLSRKSGSKMMWLEMPLDSFLNTIKATKMRGNNYGLDQYAFKDTQYFKVCDCTLNKGTISFYKGKLMQIIIGGPCNYDCLFNMFEQQFGKPIQSDTTAKINSWANDKLEVELHLNSVIKDVVSFIVLRSKKLDTEYSRYCKKHKLEKYVLWPD